MRVALILAGVVVAAIVTVQVLGSTLAPPEYELADLGISGPLAIDAVSTALESRAVWGEPRLSHGAKDRRRLHRGNLEEGDVFRVVNHARKGSTVWVRIVCRDRPDLEGWVASPADDPFRAAQGARDEGED